MDKEAPGENSSSQNVKLSQIDELKSHAEYIFAKKKALELLGTREHSVYQLKQKLLIRNFGLQAVLRVLDELQDEGSLSNIRFIEAWVRSRLKKHPEGFRSLYAGLIKSGISSDEAGKYLVPFMEEIDLDQLLEEAAKKVLKKSDITKDKLVRGLKSRGFEDSSIIRFIESHYHK